MSRPIYILSVDIETNGPNLLKNEIISLGYCIGSITGKIIKKERINFAYNTEFEPSCLEFWKKNQKILEYISQDQLEPEFAIKKFIDCVDDLDNKYDLRIITDNPSFDISFINYYLNKYLNRLPINYVLGNGNNYRCIFYTDSYSRGVLHQNYINPWTSDSAIINKFKLKINSSHNHYPDDDAEYIYNLHISLINKLQNKY
jgi:hypothetical protein